MGETAKLAGYRRRHGYGAYFVGRGIDIGCGDDPLAVDAFPGITTVERYDKNAGDAQDCGNLADNNYDFVYSSHCLEHLANPYCALKNWIRICRVGGHIVVAVPHEIFYEKMQWPSPFNGDHKTSWTLEWRSNLPRSVHLPDFLRSFPNVRVLRMETVLENFDFTRFGDDQTAGNASAQIDFVVRKMAGA